MDALVGRQTRAHRDLGLGIAADREATALAALSELGYAVETDWRPVRVEVVQPWPGLATVEPADSSRRRQLLR